MVHGPTLGELVGLALERGTAFSEGFVLYVGAELASALAHVHTRKDEHGTPLGIVHRNLCTETVRLTWRGEVKLADFGLARSKLPERHATTLRRPRGSLFFTSPETLFEQKVDARSDLFAVGLVLLEFATGKHLFDPAHKTHVEMRASLPPHERRHVERMARAMLKTGQDSSAEQALWGAATFTPEDVEAAAAPLSAPLRSILERLLRRAPAERFQKAEELEAALLGRLAEVGGYDGRAAVAEMKKAISEASEALISQEWAPGLLSPHRGDARSASISTR